MRAVRGILGCLAAGLFMVGLAATADEEKAARTVVIKSVEVKTTQKNGDHWDINEGKPDLAVIVRNMTVKDSKGFESKEMANTFTSKVNALTTVQVRAGDQLLLEVMDKDAVIHDTIGKIEKNLTQEDLDKGTLKIENFGQVVQLEIEFKKP